MKNFIIKIGAVLLTVAIAGNALAAGKIVFDPTNFGRNVITAAQSVKQTAQLALQYKNMVERYLLMMRDLKQLDPAVIQMGIDRGMLPPEALGGTKTDVMKQAAGVYATYGQTASEMAAMSQTLENLQSQSLDLSRMSSQQGKSISDILTAQAAAAGQGRDYAAHELGRLQLTLGQLAQHRKRADALAAQIPQNSGTVEALGTVAAQNHLITDQLSSLLQVSISSAQASQASAVDVQSDRQHSREIARQAEERNRQLWGESK